MKLHFLGTTGYHPNNHRQTACLMIPELGLILDAGTGIFRARDLIQTSSLDLFLTHAHLDHSIGLTFLLGILYEKSVDRVTVHISEDKIDAIERHLFADPLFPVPPRFEIKAIPHREKMKLNGSAELSSFPVEHPGGCLAFRIDGLPENRSLAYVTDTTADLNAPYVKFIEGVDTLIHECYFPDGWEELAALTGHSCLTPVAEVARAAGAKQCYLVHINPLNEQEPPLDLSSAKDIFPAIEAAFDRQTIEV